MCPMFADGNSTSKIEAALSNGWALLLRWMQSSRLREISGVFILKAAIVVSSFALLTLASRVLGATDFGTYSVLFSAVGISCVIGTFGQQVVVMRTWNEYAATGDAAHLAKVRIAHPAAHARDQRRRQRIFIVSEHAAHTGGAGP